MLGRELARILRKLADGLPLTAQELNALSARLDVMDNQAAKQTHWMDVQGNMAYDLFLRHRPPQGFAIGPMESAMLFSGSNTHVIPSGAWTRIQGYDDPKDVNPLDTASHGFGFDTDASGGYIVVAGARREYKLRFLATVEVPYHASITELGLRWAADDGSLRGELTPASAVFSGTNDGLMTLSHARTTSAVQSQYHIEFYHNRGADHTLSTNSVLFSCDRIR